MSIVSLWTLQLMMFMMMAAGMILTKVGILKSEGKVMMTDLVLYFLLPCNIINSFRMEFSFDILIRFATLLVVSCLVMVLSYVFSKTLYNKSETGIKKVMQYSTIVSNSGFLGLPIAQGMFGAEGLMYGSIYIIPMRIMMWTAGISCFNEDAETDMKAVAKKLALHPCIVAVYIGFFLMFFEPSLTDWMNSLGETNLFGTALIMVSTALDKGVRSAGGCVTAMTMLLIGIMMSEIDPKTMINKDTIKISIIRLILIPGIAFIGCRIFGVNNLVTGVSVVLAGMPAGSTAAMLAAKYNCDYVFGTKCVVVTTLLSMLTIPIWGMVLI